VVKFKLVGVQQILRQILEKRSAIVDPIGINKRVHHKWTQLVDNPIITEIIAKIALISVDQVIIDPYGL